MSISSFETTHCPRRESRTAPTAINNYNKARSAQQQAVTTLTPLLFGASFDMRTVLIHRASNGNPKGGQSVEMKMNVCLCPQNEAGTCQ